MNDAFAAALRLLKRREHGALELARKLIQKGHAEDAVEEALAECQRLGYQSDHRFVEAFCRYRFNQGYGPVKIRHELLTRGIDADLIKQELKMFEAECLSQAESIWKKKFKAHKGCCLREKQKQQQYLLYRGFSVEVISQVLQSS